MSEDKKPRATLPTMVEVDADAMLIGELYQKAKTSIIDSVKYQMECGRALTIKKNSLVHGEWLPWLEANSGTLGFESRLTAARLMKLANVSSTTHLESPAQALQISRDVWGNSAPRGLGEAPDNEWYTPALYIEAAREVLGTIDVDPASCPEAQETVRATKYYAQETNGLDKEWHGRVWLNPPYSYPLVEHFVFKLLDEAAAGRVPSAILLTNPFTDTAWFHRVASHADAICFTRGRIKFLKPGEEKNSPPVGSTFFYFGEGPTKFASRFQEFGIVFPGPF